MSYFVGVILILAGVCLLVNKKARPAATVLGLTILLTVLWIYLPMRLAPTDVVLLASGSPERIAETVRSSLKRPRPDVRKRQ